MPTSQLLVDSSFLYALYDRANRRNDDANIVAEVYGGQFVIPYVVLTETAWLFRRSDDIRGVTSFLDALIAASYDYEIVLLSDLRRARAIMQQYIDSRLDFVDCCIMALSERMNITQVCTFDYRDFSIFRPLHCDALELLP
jgi:hypothetical protein